MTIQMIQSIDILARVFAAALLGAAIGAERQWRARTAGLRTNALVALGSSLFVVMGALGFAASGSDPTRVAAQVVSGIGFLGAGVIMKQGGSVSGINTAATLWASAAVGALCGAGMYAIAAVGAVAVMGANLLLRPVAHLLDRHGMVRRVESDGVEYTFEVHCQQADEVHVRSIVFDAVHKGPFLVRTISATDLPDAAVIITATLYTPKRDDVMLERAIAAVIKAPEVLGIRWSCEHLTAAD